MIRRLAGDVREDVASVVVDSQVPRCGGEADLMQKVKQTRHKV